MEYNPEQAIRYGAAASRFLNDTTIQQIFMELDLLYWQQLKAAASPAERERIAAKAGALDDLKVTLQAVVDSGDRATHDLERGTRPV